MPKVATSTPWRALNTVNGPTRTGSPSTFPLSRGSWSPLLENPAYHCGSWIGLTVMRLVLSRGDDQAA